MFVFEIFYTPVLCRHILLRRALKRHFPGSPNSDLFGIVPGISTSWNCFNFHPIDNCEVMVEVRKFCCCASNLVCAKVLGSIGIALTILNLVKWIIDVILIGFVEIMALPLVGYLVALVSNICLVVGAYKKNTSLLLVWLILACIGLLLYIGIFILACLSGALVLIFSYLIAIGLGIWTILVVYGASQEIKYC